MQKRLKQSKAISFCKSNTKAMDCFLCFKERKAKRAEVRPTEANWRNTSRTQNRTKSESPESKSLKTSISPNFTGNLFEIERTALKSLFKANCWDFVAFCTFQSFLYFEPIPPCGSEQNGKVSENLGKSNSV